MGLGTSFIDFQNTGKERSLRCDVDFIDFQNNFLINNYYSFNDLFQFQKNNKVDINKLDGDFFYSEIGNVSKEGEVKPVRLNFNERNLKDEGYYKKIENRDIIQVEKNDILLSKVRPNLKKYVLVDEENKKYFYTSAFIHLKPKKLNKILYYSFKTVFYKNLIAISRQGKSYPTLNEDDFLYLKFDKKIIDKFEQKQNSIIAQIEPIEECIKKLRSQIKETQEIINQVFAREFGFDLKKFKELKREKVFNRDFVTISNHRDLKSNFRTLKITKEELKFKNVKYFQIKKIAKGIFAGADKPKNFSEEKTEQYNIPVYANGKKENGLLGYTDKFRIDKPCVTISARGTIGFSVARNEKFFPIVRLITVIPDEDKILNDYLAYTLNFIDIDKTGNTIDQLTVPTTEDIKIPVPDRKNQCKIVNEIKVELEKRDNINKQIQTERSKIDKIIQHA